MSSDPGGNKGPNTGPAGMTGTTTVAGKTVKQYGTKQDAEKSNLQNCQKSTNNKGKDTKIIGTPGALKDAFASGTSVTSQFCTDKVLKSSKAK